MKVRSLTSEVALVLDADEPAATAVFAQPLAEQFAQQFGFAQIGELKTAEVTRAPVWIALRGQVAADDGRLIAINQARGSAIDVVLEVDGSSDDAEIALEKIWRALSSLRKSLLRPAEDVGTWTHQTTAVVDLTKSFEELFPIAKHFRERVTAAVEKTPFKTPERLQHRYSFEVPLSLGHRSINRKFSFEPRASARSEKTFWTQSPLRSKEHLEILERLDA